MAKLSTDAIKELISQWLAENTDREDLRHHSDYTSQDDIDNVAAWYKGRMGLTLEDALEAFDDYRKKVGLITI